MPKRDRGARARASAPASTWRQRRAVEVALAADRAPLELLPRLPPRSIALCLGLAILLLAPWPGYGRLFGPPFCAFGNAVIVVVGAGGDSAPRFSTRPRDSTATPDAGATDWTVWLAARSGDGPSRPSLPLETRILGYTPLALSLALTLSFAVSWRRKLRMLGIGLALLLMRLAIAIALPVSRAFSPHPAAPGPVSELVWYVLIDLPAMSYVAPLFGWWIAFAATRDGSAES
ncbi:MAG TPA: hypothetical protein VLC06_01950 [Polyangia bacterium]|nr:hypothetical protein [Polyangia bacterium]